MKFIKDMKNPWLEGFRALGRLLRVRSEERGLALVGGLWFAFLNLWTIVKYFDAFSGLASDYRRVFVGKFYASGFDPFTYVVVSDWGMAYNVYRHPLLSFFLYPLYLVNRLLMALTGMNWATILVGCLLTACSFYALLFAYRIFREIIGLSRRDATLFSAYLFSMGYIWLSCMVPDHFVMSLMLLLMTFYVAGVHLRQHRPMGAVTTVALFVCTAGVTLSNGLKTFLTALFTNGHRFFRLRFFLGAVVVPALAVWLCAVAENKIWIEPQEKLAEQKMKAKNDSITQAIWRQVADTARTKDSATIAAGVHRIIRKRIHAKYAYDHKQPWNLHKGKPMGKGKFVNWTDESTPRGASVVENLFGESIQLHADHCLQDVLRERPVIVRYRSAGPYVVEGIVVLLFVCGIVAGRRSRWLWMILACASLDMLLHLGLGFGLNEVYIMAAHWLYVVPMASAFLMNAWNGRWQRLTRLLVLSLTAYLLVSNGALIF